MKKSIFAMFLCFIAAACITAQNRPKPEQLTVTGSITQFGSNLILTTTDGKVFTVMNSDEMPPKPPKNSGEKLPPEAKEFENNPPKQVTAKELLALNGKTVSITGFIPQFPPEFQDNKPEMADKDMKLPQPSKDGFFMVISYK